ncbi:MAG: FAD-dependent oxidoreductase [Desulfobacteraceae bacterium]|jgi:monoamine oxidase
MESVETIIIGAGLSGIYAAFLLSQKNREYLILEARGRTGGRIHGSEHEGLVSDMGPSWYWPDIHPKITGLINDLGLSGYRQYESGLGRFQYNTGQISTVRGYNNEPPSWRISGGITNLLSRLLDNIPGKSIRMKHPVCRIEKTPSGVLVGVGDLENEPVSLFYAKRVILALPPRLAAFTILFTPGLSFELTQEMLKTGTWMAGQAKFCALYNEPFWRSHGLSGQAFSQYGPIGEIHDGSNDGRAPYGLMGFLGLPAVGRSNNRELKDSMLGQLGLLYGEPAADPAAFFYIDWAKERYTATDYDQPPMLEHPLYSPPAGKISIWDDSVRFAGTETAEEHGGYMEGAVIAAERAVMNI